MSIEYVQQQLGAAEKILYTERHHWVFFVAEMVRWILFAAAVLALIILLRVWWLPDAGWVWWLLLVFLLPAGRIAWGFLSWKMNVYVLTNRRVIESTGVLSKRVADSSLEKLTDIVLKQSILGRALNYGDIIVLTAAANAGISNLKQIRRPMEFKTQMLNAKEELERQLGGSN
ncbi:MAG TPA: PH domain-containing protein [Rhodospirillales bacterium]|nr:PH domain-containing protein [Rhodospirillales bacterium]